MEISKVCPVCHQSFKAKRSTHIYCCSYCRKKHHKEVYYNYHTHQSVEKLTINTHILLVQKIDRYYPSSQICHVCGTKNPETKNLAVREWICAKCKTSHDRDRNAAINIWKVGASTFFGEI